MINDSDEMPESRLISNEQDFKAFEAELERRLKVDLSQYKQTQMRRRINTMVKAKGCKTYMEFLRECDKDKSLWERFVDRLTINVSEFFRNNEKFTDLAKIYIPGLIKTKGSNPLRIFSAGCSTGEEPYTLAMIMAENFPGIPYSIYAVDFDIKILERAKIGIYTKNQVAGVSPTLLKKYFTQVGENFQIKIEMKRFIEWDKMNLLTASFKREFDLILCRNVVIYFNEDTKSVLFEKFSKSLRVGGVLFVGASERINNYHLINLNSPAPFFYIRK